MLGKNILPLYFGSWSLCSFWTHVPMILVRCWLQVRPFWPLCFVWLCDWGHEADLNCDFRLELQGVLEPQLSDHSCSRIHCLSPVWSYPTVSSCPVKNENLNFYSCLQHKHLRPLYVVFAMYLWGQCKNRWGETGIKAITQVFAIRNWRSCRVAWHFPDSIQPHPTLEVTLKLVGSGGVTG